MFSIGGTGTDSLAGVTATLRELPSLAGLQLETLEAPGTDGLVFGGSTRTRARLKFDVILHGDTPAELEERRGAFTRLIDPARGQQRLEADAAPGWYWDAIVADEIAWTRLSWDRTVGYQLRADVVFDAHPYAKPNTDESWSLTGTGQLTLRRELGNAVSYPRVTIRGALTSTQHVELTLAGTTVRVTGPLTTAQALVLDYDRFAFEQQANGVKVASLIRRMSNLDRFELWPQLDTTLTVSTTGTVTTTTVNANSRRS